MTIFSPKSRRHLFSCLLLFIQMAEVEATGTMALTINYFQNPTEHLDDGSCCDLFCAGQCDDIFHFSLDQSSGRTGDASSYFYWTKITGTFQDQNNVYFNDNMNGVNNPIIWTFDSWPGSVLFKVYIEDDDSPFTSNDYLDGMVQRLTLTPAKTKSQATSATIIMYGLRARDKTLLSVSYTLYCDENYYGSSCSVYCVPQDSTSTGHYTCDADTGEKICRAGWEDASNDCLTFADDCLGKDCRNGHCVDGVHSYSCSCNEGYTGTSCETNINECGSSPCQHGSSCSDLVDGYTCACPNGFVGPRCEYVACSKANLCLNNGTCYGDQQCLCRPGYFGTLCQQRMCDAVPCINGGTCSSNGTCLCPPEYTGNQCDVLKCDFISNHCKNNGSCVEGKCVCRKANYGTSCEKERCTNSTCQNGGSCVVTDEDIGYRCQCTQGYSGQNCQSPGNLCSMPVNDKQIGDVSIFVGDVGILLIILIVLCILLFVIVVILIGIMCYRRRKKRVCEKRRIASTTSTTTMISSVDRSLSSSSSSSPEGYRLENDYGSCSLDDAFSGNAVSPSSESTDNPWKKVIDDKTKVSGSPDENHYEKLDGMMAEQAEMTAGEGPQDATGLADKSA